ncbi:mitochondrial antiviral-signaling protein [Syngnathoides biaculeatus]|uniref:mitochondrial antiviral-signaling protein n=1 Tax=Syngnathoides biaculeatus TaxID=300417 RepID=UPI002ADDCF20|nr:mitochondrial antiviral-signaling protein [Syngnathoides biaculeatus]
MSFARDQLYNGYLRTNMPTIVTRVKVREIVVHLPCLTAHDRETIEAKRETCGNYDGMVHLLDCLKRRQSWPEHFIRALEMCEHGAIAAEVRAEYDRLRGAGDSTRVSPPTTLANAQVHPTPPGPEAAAAATSPPSPPRADPEPEVPVPASASPPASRPPLATAAPPEATPPRGAEGPDRHHPEPEESSESDMLDAEAMAKDVPSGCVAPPLPDQNPEPCDATESPPESSVRPDATDVPPTPEKPPVQETSPPPEKVVSAPDIPPPDDIPVAPPTQVVVENRTATGSPRASPAPPEVASACQAAPRTLSSIVPPQGPNPDAGGSPTEAYSGGSERLEMSKEEEDEGDVRVNVAHVSWQPPVLDLDGQRVLNGDAGKEAASAQEPEPDEPAPRGALAANAKYVATAVGVGACALLVAWKFKH